MPQAQAAIPDAESSVDPASSVQAVRTPKRMSNTILPEFNDVANVSDASSNVSAAASKSMPLN